MIKEELILKYLSNVKKASFIEIAKNLNVPRKLNHQLSSVLNKLREDEKIFFSRRFDIFFVSDLIGTFEVEYITNQKGLKFCFFKKEQDTEERKALIFNNKIGALKGDVISVNVYEDIQNNFYIATINKIIKSKTNFIYAQIDDNLEIKPIGYNPNIPLVIDKTKLKPNCFATFKINKIVKEHLLLDLDKINYFFNEPFSDIKFMVDTFFVKKDFDDLVIEEAKAIPDEVIVDNKYERVDLTNQMIVTIDGEKTKDFDDAINVIKKENGNYILGVHIADVAYYVKENSNIDLEARERATSIYLPEHVIPMLPEKLSNGICSLNPNVKRFTLSLETEIDQEGNVISKKIFPAIIESKHRLTYKQVENMNNDMEIKNNVELFNMLKFAYELSDILGKKKKNEGYINFEIEEPIVEVDKQTGKTIDIKSRIRLSSEILIENFMVFANETISRLISNLNIPSIYRIHDIPDKEKISSLYSFMKNLGISNVNMKDCEKPRGFQLMVNDIKKQRFDSLVKMALLRTMQKAKYSTNNIGHFGLASEYYSHFTSPIRRYPDLLLHRIIWEVLLKGNKDYSINKQNEIESIALHSTEAEIRAIELERKVNDIKKAEYYENKIGDIKEAVIVSIQKFGIFVEFEDLTNSLIHISNITTSFDIEIIDDGCKMLIKDENKMFCLGQKVKVKILSISKMEGKIDSIII